jgi:putative protease
MTNALGSRYDGVVHRTPSGFPVTVVKPELLAPAGDLDCLRAAIENGADAVYFGLQGHNARARAANFDLDSLPDVLHLLHERGVKGYIALNTLVFTSELPEVEQIIRHVALAGADAIITQDIAVIRMARALCPDLPVHASTQMTLTSAESIRLVEELGVERVILARELSLDEIRKIRGQTQMSLEVFVHGALCVAYSGQCLTSEALGGRSANRGQCAQACRLPYQVVCDGETVPLGDYQYVLSPQDLAGYDLVPALIELGVACFKIEGRLKTAEYVANMTRHYRMAIDAAVAGRLVVFTPRQVQEMELSFSRGFSHGWLGGNNHKVLVQGRSPTKRGVYLGEVLSVRRGRVALRLAAPLKRGDGVVFDRGRPEEVEQGGRVYEIFHGRQSVTGSVSTGEVELAFGRGDVELEEIHPGDHVWKTDDPELTRRLRATFTGDPKRRVPLSISATAAVGATLRIVCRAENGATAEVESAEPLAEAIKHPLDEPLLREQLGRLGKSIYELRDVKADIVGRPMAPLSVLGQMRHEMLWQLAASIARPRQRLVSEGSALAQLRSLIPVSPDAPQKDICLRSEGQSYTLRVLCRNLPQLAAALEAGVAELYVDFQDIREYAGAVRKARDAGKSIYLATPRIQKPNEGPLFKHLLRHQPDGILVRNLGGLLFYTQRGVPAVADFSLNAANELTVQLYRERGASRVTASYDLNREQLLDLVQAVPPAWLEVVIHQHMPMFHMAHCVFCAVLSPGTNRTNCGRPCDRHEVKLRDRMGMEHPLTADVGCRNTLYNAVPQSAAEVASQLVARGVRDFRLELLAQSPEEVGPTLDLYRRLLAGETSGHEVWTASAGQLGALRLRMHSSQLARCSVSPSGVL